MSADCFGCGHIRGVLHLIWIHFKIDITLSLNNTMGLLEDNGFVDDVHFAGPGFPSKVDADLI